MCYLQAVADCLIMLKITFPRADAAKVFLQHPIYLLQQDQEYLRVASERLREIIPDVDIDK